MSTPLGALIRSVLTDPDAQAAFASAPEAFLADHGYTDLEPQDVREALYVLADGSPPETAVRLVAGGDTLADVDGDDGGLGATAAGLLGALHVATDASESLDPSHLDGWDDPDDRAAGGDEAGEGEAHEGDADDGDAADGDAAGGDADDALDGAATLDGADPGDLDGPGLPGPPIHDAGIDEPDHTSVTPVEEFDHDPFGGSDPADGLDPDPFSVLPDLDADLSPLAPDTSLPALPDEEVGDGWDDVI